MVFPPSCILHIFSNLGDGDGRRKRAGYNFLWSVGNFDMPFSYFEQPQKSCSFRAAVPSPGRKSNVLDTLAAGVFFCFENWMDGQ